MTNDDIETLIRRLIAAGMGVLVLFAAPPAGDAKTSDPPAATVHSDSDRSDDRTQSAGAATSAAVKLGWGKPTHVDEFTGGLGKDWDVYDGPGHEGKGERSPSAVSVRDGIMTITGDADGKTAGMA